MGDDPLPPIELIAADEDMAETTVVQNGGTDERLHTWLRTGAALVAALGLLWMATSVRTMSSADDRQACMVEIQTAMWSSPRDTPRSDDDFLQLMADRAADCGLPLFAESIRDELDEQDDD